LQQTLQNQKRTTNILGFQILNQEQKETANKAKSFWIFEYQTETRW
jgi:hypothetical protein